MLLPGFESRPLDVVSSAFVELVGCDERLIGWLIAFSHLQESLCMFILLLVFLNLPPWLHV
jgi:hypothetical protein